MAAAKEQVNLEPSDDETGPQHDPATRPETTAKSIAVEVRPRMTFPDGLRAIASLLVVLPHSVGMFLIVKTHSPITRFAIKVSGLGTVGVEIFFVLSGFVIAYTIREQRVTLRYLGIFFLRRSVRLDPPYWCAIALGIIYLALQTRISPAHARLPTLGTVLAHLFYLQDILRLRPINIVFWTLCIEVQLYIAFCSFVGLAQAVTSRMGGSIQRVGVGIYLLSLLWPAKLLPAVPGFFFSYWYAFMAGVIVWWACDRRLRWRTAILLLTPLAAIAIYTQGKMEITVVISAIALLWCARLDGLHRWLKYRFVLFIGRLSYCLYLVHVPISGVVLALLTRLNSQNEVVAYAALFLTYTFSILAASGLHEIVEVPALRWSQRLKSLHDRPPARIAVS